MQEQRRAATCCGRCGGTGAAARAALRTLYKSAVFPPPAGRPKADGRASPAGLPDVAIGSVLDVSPHVLVIATPGGERRFTLSPGAAAWRGRQADPTAARTGDRVVVRLCPGRRDVADKIWAGIGRVTGTIIKRDAGSLLVDEGVTRPRQNVIISPGAVNRIQVRFPRLTPGSLIDLIGLRRGTVLEALVPATAQPTGRPGPGMSAVTGPRPGTISGSATWHEPAGLPSDEDGLAYPAIDPAAGCAEAAPPVGACSSLPLLAVGSMLAVRNECAGMSRTLRVTHCGAVARLFCDRCMTCGTSPRARIADLALASFVRLGGDLERGCFNATVSIGW